MSSGTVLKAELLLSFEQHLSCQGIYFSSLARSQGGQQPDGRVAHNQKRLVTVINDPRE